MVSIVLTGGGTGGHIMPNLALVPYLKPHFEAIHYIGSQNGTDAALVGQQPSVIFHATKTVKLFRSLTPKNLAIPFALVEGKNQAKKILRQINPNIVFGKGGFASLPTCLAARELGIPYIIHESDCSLGLANRILARHAAAVITAFDTIKGKNVVCLGTPLRPQLFAGNRSVLSAKLDPSVPTLLVLGGSSGAVFLNRMVAECLDDLTKKYNVLHLVGKSGNRASGYRYHSFEFAHNIEDFFAAADFVVSRAGANTLFELIALSKPTLAIPLPKSRTSRGDQVQNAKILQEKGFLLSADQNSLTKQSFLAAIETLSQFKPHAAPPKNSASAIVELLLEKMRK